MKYIALQKISMAVFIVYNILRIGVTIDQIKN